VALFHYYTLLPAHRKGVFRRFFLPTSFAAPRLLSLSLAVPCFGSLMPFFVWLLPPTILSMIFICKHVIEGRQSRTILRDPFLLGERGGVAFRAEKRSSSLLAVFAIFYGF